MEAQENGSRADAYRVLRYTPNLVRDEWLNVGVLVFDPKTGERRLRVIDEPAEYARVRKLHPQADEALLRALRDDLEDRFAGASMLFGNGHEQASADWLKPLGKWDETLSNALQLATQKGVYADDLDAETERLYADHVAPRPAASRVSAPGSPGVKFAATARRYSSRRDSGTACRRVCARRPSPFQAIPCAWTLGTGETAPPVCASAESFARAGGCQAACLYRHAHSGENRIERIHRGNRRAPAGGKRTAPLRAGNSTRGWRGKRGHGGICGLDRQDAADNSVRERSVTSDQ